MRVTSGIPGVQVPRSWVWAGAYVAALAAMVADANLELLDEPWRWMLKALVVVLVIPMLLSSRRQAEEEGPASPALRNLNMRMLAAAGFCIATFSIGASIYRTGSLSTTALWTLGLVTAVPVLVMVGVMVRYFTEETDEYLRHLATTSALIGVAAVLVLATVWGFLESLGLVAHAPSWYLVPLFAVAQGIGRAWLKARQ